MRVRAYLRRSLARDGRSEGIDVQRASVAAEVERRGWQLDQTEYVDDDRSAFRDDIDNRPAMRQALADARARRYDVLAVYKWDRLARSEAIYHTLLADFRKAGIKVISATESDEPLARSLSGLFAAEYSRALSKRMTDVRRHEAQHGILVGPAPIGYTRGPDGIPVPNDDAPMVRELGELYASGVWSAARLARQFGLHTDAVHEMLRCETYAGAIVCKGERYEGRHEPIWPAELWERIQHTRAARSRRRGRVKDDQPGLLNGLMVCGGCGAPLWRQNRDRYRCSTLMVERPGPIPGLKCTGGGVPATPVEQGILGLLAGLATIPDLLADIDQEIAALAGRPTAHQRDTRALESLKLAFLRDEISASDYERRRQEVERQASTPSALMPDPRAARALLRDLPALIAAATPGELAPVVRELITEVYARRKQILAIRPTMVGALILRPVGRYLSNVVDMPAGIPPGPPSAPSPPPVPAELSSPHVGPGAGAATDLSC